MRKQPPRQKHFCATFWWQKVAKRLFESAIKPMAIYLQKNGDYQTNVQQSPNYKYSPNLINLTQNHRRARSVVNL